MPLGYFLLVDLYYCKMTPDPDGPDCSEGNGELTTIFFCLVKGHFSRGGLCPVCDLTDIYYYLRIAIFI